jgi:hypothetical protein
MSWAQILRHCVRVQKKLAKRQGKNYPMMWGSPGIGKTVTLLMANQSRTIRRGSAKSRAGLKK